MIRDTIAYVNPATGSVDTYQGSTFADSEASGRLAVTGEQAEDSLSAKLLDLENRSFEIDRAIAVSTDSYNQAVKDPGRKKITEVSGPVSPVLIAIAVYLVISWM